MFETFKNRLEIAGTLTAVTALRVGAGRSVEPLGSDLPVFKDSIGQPMIPGSSFKGALRARLESFLRGMLGDDRRYVANPANEREWSIRVEEMKQLKQNYQDDSKLTDAILASTDLASSLFGSPWLASKFQVRDLTVLQESWFGQYQERDGVAIDRDTETAAEKKLYDFQVVPAGTQFHFEAVTENAAEWELGLLVLGLRQFETEQVPLGGGRSRGLGVVRLGTSAMHWIDVEGDPDALLQYLQQLTSSNRNDAFQDGYLYRDRWVQSTIQCLENQLRSQPANKANSST